MLEFRTGIDVKTICLYKSEDSSQERACLTTMAGTLDSITLALAGMLGELAGVAETFV
jgi:hypothetical protein